ncbi:S8 family serine peptidase [Pontibacter harenae]|uniref:S8 family serine peptidase n=1 Tax=Pontibacter harenae TaxID=2894083 RepID=UPI001E49D098|nr:S8 family serine peptidase [Pontibacter harenae]MCC9166384.1 S8 family serine peptidase [Pontibacter harenae]
MFIPLRAFKYLFLGIYSVIYFGLAFTASAQGKGAFGAQTQPNTVVYKLKQSSTTNARNAQGASRSFEEALSKVGAKKPQQKFPQSRSNSSSSRRSATTVDLSLIYELNYGTSQSFEQVKKVLLATGMVEYVEPLYKREPFYQPNDPAADSALTTQAYLKVIKAYGGWAVTKGDDKVVIGILDTGFRLSHNDLRSKAHQNTSDPIDGVDNDNDGYIDNFEGWDFADNDNDVTDDTPLNTPRGHGTAVTGVAAAASDNGIGMASVGYNSLFMPLKVFSKNSYGRFGGYEAIVYAADHGCKVINLSWGGPHYSRFEQDVINYAVLEKDVVIVVSAGNKNENILYYPASYDNVISVGGTNNLDVKHASYTYNRLIDVTAPSVGIYTTLLNNDNAYGNASGTSYAAPIVSGAAALVRAKYPNLTAQQVMERVRVTTDNIYHLAGNAPYIEYLGKGRLNVKRAVSEVNPKSIRATAQKLLNNRLGLAGDTAELGINFTNFLAPTTNATVSLTTESPYVTVLDGQASLGSMATLASKNNHASPFKFKVASNTPYNTEVYFRIGFSDGDYTDLQYVRVNINPPFVTLDANNLHVSINALGNFGYDGYSSSQGVGVRYKGSSSLLAEGGLIIASSATQVSDNVRNDAWGVDGDFTIVRPARFNHQSKVATQEATSAYTDAQSPNPVVGVQLKHKALAWNSEATNQDFVILEYYITNITADTIQKLHTGLFADWDIGSPYVNAAEWDGQLKAGYVYNMLEKLPVAGIKLLTHDAPSFYAIDNNGSVANTISIIDGFSNGEKYHTLAEGVARTKADGNGTGNDVSYVMGAVANKLAPGETKVVAFALVAGNDLTSFKVHAEAAQMQYYKIKAGAPPVVQSQFTCAGTAVTVAPTGGHVFKFYSDANKSQLLASGSSYSIPKLNTTTTIYVTNADSLFESAVVPVTFTISPPPVAKFTAVAGVGNEQTTVSFSNQSTSSTQWFWQFGDGTTSEEANPIHDYGQPGFYRVTLTTRNEANCTLSSYIQTVGVFYESLTLFPNPSSGTIRASLPSPVDKMANAPFSTPNLYLTDTTGRKVKAKLKSSNGIEASFDLSGIAPGVYVAQLEYDNSTTDTKVVVL